MSLLAFFEQLAESSWSVELHESQYAYSIIESIHVWTLCLFFGTVAMVDLRLLGWIMPGVPVSEFARRVLPWTIAGFIILVITGTLLVFAIPVRTYQSIFFRGKMLLLVLAGLNVWFFHSRVYPTFAKWDVDAVPPRAVRVAGAVSLVLWSCIIFSGRMIAYNWFDCDRQPQPAIVNVLTSCVPTDSGH
jgi:hypothetical protein